MVANSHQSMFWSREVAWVWTFAAVPALTKTASRMTLLPGLWLRPLVSAVSRAAKSAARLVFCLRRIDHGPLVVLVLFGWFVACLFCGAPERSSLTSGEMELPSADVESSVGDELSSPPHASSVDLISVAPSIIPSSQLENLKSIFGESASSRSTSPGRSLGGSGG